MSLFDPGSGPARQGTPAADTKEEARRQEIENEQRDQLDSQLKQESPDEEMYKVLQNFLLADPERQIPQLGGIDNITTEAERAKERGDLTSARANYETSAKVEIYDKNKDAAKKFLSLAQQVTDDPRHKEFHEKLISNMDLVMRISADYYEKMAEQKRQLEQHLEQKR